MPPPPTPTHPPPQPFLPPPAPSDLPTSTTTPSNPSTQAHAQTHSTSASSTYENRQERARAAQILANAELLLWFSAARGESLPQTRHYFEMQLLGLEPEAPVWRDAHEVPTVAAHGGKVGSPARGGKGKERERERDDEREREREKKRKG